MVAQVVNSSFLFGWVQMIQIVALIASQMAGTVIVDARLL